MPPPGDRLGALFGSLGILGACLGLGAILPPELPLPAIFLLFLLATALIAQKWGLGTGAVAVLASAIIFDLVFDSAQGSLRVGNWPLMALFIVVLGGGQFAVALSERLEQQTRASRRRAALQAALLLLGRNFAKCTSPLEIATALSHLSERLIHRPIYLLVRQADDAWKTLPGQALEPLAVPDFGPSSQQESLEPKLDGHHAYLPLGHGSALESVLCLPASDRNELDSETLELLRGFAVQVALALERVRWLETAQQVRLENESERMRSSLLGAISHDLRTPLAGIQGAASALLLDSDAIPEATRRDLLGMIHGESQRLTQLITNLLDLTRLESGAIRVQKEWHSLEEVVGSVLRRTESGPAQVRVELPDDLPLVAMDAALMEQLLINLLENARRHAPGSPVTLGALLQNNSLEIHVSDHGPGIPEDYRERVFDKFFRLPGRTTDGGVGLGLAICDAIAKAHGGSIQAHSPREGGASFRVILPMEDAPSIPPEPEDAKP